jgi:hypothetical protein
MIFSCRSIQDWPEEDEPMNNRSRLLSRCATFSGSSHTPRVDVGAVARRLLLFDTYILESTRLSEIPLLIQAFGPSGFTTLLNEGALRVQCQAVAIADVGQSTLKEKRRRLGPLPPGSVSLAKVTSANAEKYIHDSLQNVQAIENLTHKETKKVKLAIVEHLENSPAELGAETISNTRVDLARQYLLNAAIVRSGRESPGVEIDLSSLISKAEDIGDDEFRVETNLSKLTNLDERQIHDVVVRAVLAIANINWRFEAMKAHDCLSGVLDDDTAFLGQKLGFLLREIAPGRQEDHFDRVIHLAGFPDISLETEDCPIDADRLLKARESAACLEFRAWLQHLDTLSDQEIVDRVRGVKATVDGLFQSRGGKAARFLCVTLGGLIPQYGTVVGPVLGALDMFILDKIFTRRGPAAFIHDFYQPLFDRSHRGAG